MAIELDLALDDHGPKYLQSRREPRAGNIAIFGVPFDGTTSFRPGARFGPDALRAVSVVLEGHGERRGRRTRGDVHTRVGESGCIGRHDDDASARSDAGRHQDRARRRGTVRRVLRVRVALGAVAGVRDRRVHFGRCVGRRIIRG